MIITDIGDIDCLVEQLVGEDNSFVSIDINDYKLIKSQSSSLKAIELELSELSDTTIKSINDAISEAGGNGVCNVLFYVCGSGNNLGLKALSMQQLQRLLGTIRDRIGSANMIWGGGEGEIGNDTFKILIVLGYSS